jgi:hypothetical protein
MSYIALATTTLGSSSGSVTFSSIPTSVSGVALRDLIVVVAGTTTSAVGVALRFNSDSGSNYSYVLMDGFGSGAGSSSASGSDNAMNMGVIGNGQSNVIYQVMDYSATDKHKSALNRTNALSWGGVRAGAGRWANTNAINTVQVLTMGANTFSSGTTFSLYGVA